MNQNHLFTSTRWRLASSYTIVMGLILSLCGIGLYQTVAHAHLQSQDRELESLSGVLHDSLEPILKQPGQIDTSVQRVLPNLCILAENSKASCAQVNHLKRHILGTIQQDNYYARFWTLSGGSVAVAGNLPEEIPANLDTTTWQTLQTKNDRYHQVSILLKNNQNQPWGYMQVGHSLKESDRHLATLKLILLLGLPISMLLVGGASWWLAGKAMRPVYSSYQQIQQFTADAAHELRTPLAVICAAVELALAASPEPEADSTLRTVERQSMRLSQLVQDLLLLSRLDRQDRQPLATEWQPCCLNDLISDLVEELADLAISASIQLEQDIQIEQPLYILGNENGLYRLVANLITNAIQHTPPGGKVTVTLDCEDRHAVIQVKDTGSGIAPEDRARIFDRFYRASSDRSRKTGGSGLGLAIARAIALAHQGSIQVKSELGKGSIFTVRLLRLNSHFTPKSATNL